MNELSLREDIAEPREARGRGGVALVVVLLLVLGLWCGVSVPFGVDQGTQAIVTRLGDPRRLVTEAGLHFKLPWPLESLRTFDTRLHLLRAEPMEMLTADKRNLVAEVFVIYRILDSRLFLRSVGSFTDLELPLRDLVVTELGASMGELEMVAHISTDQGELGTESMLDRVRDRVGESASRSFGVEVVDVGLSRLTFPSQNTSSVIKRMTAERDTIATKFRSQGREKALRIDAESEGKRREILAQAEQEAMAIRGQADAEAARIYGEAIKGNPELYKFLRTLEAYEKVFNDKTTIIIPSDAPFLEPLLGGKGEGP